jgi:exodeoxyribonuclease VII large subunit
VDETADINIQVEQFQNVYSPATLLGVYAAAIRSAADGRIVLARGLYQSAMNSREYAGHYYDTLKGVNDNGSIKLRVPSQLRSKLEENHVYVFRGYVEKRVNFSVIELVFCVDDILQKELNPMSEEDAKRFSLMQQKITKGSRDFEALVKDSIYKNEPLRIANLYGSSAIVNKDFNNGLGEAAGKFIISEYRCNFASKTEITRWMRNLDGSGAQVIALVRGGGDGGLDIFNDPDIGAEAVKLNAVLVSALGHAVNQTLIDKLADRKFDLPHHYGSSLRTWVNEAVEDQARSKSRFIEQVKTDLEKTYREQILALSTQIELNKNEKEETIRSREESFTAQLKALSAQLQAGEETLKTLKDTYELTAKQQVEAAVSQATTELASLKMDRDLSNSRRSGTQWWLYLLVGLLAGILLTFFIIR